MKSTNLGPEPETTAMVTSCRDKLPVKLEIEDSLEEEHGPLNKRSKPSQSFQEQWSSGTNAYPIPPSQYNPLDEPSPLGLRLRKSPSLLELIQMKLSQGSGSSTGGAAQGENLNSIVKKESKGTAVSGPTDKLKASNFPASLLKIGSWEYKSRYEGDLVAKCYFAKHKLVWEVLEGGLKSKIEIQWSDIMALKANCPDNGPGTLNVVLARQPLFFRETNPQPRKHTLWQATADFTDGQASLHRQHFLQCPQGLLNKHFEKLIQCDMRLNFLSQQPEIVVDAPFFEPRPSVFEDPEESKEHSFDQVDSGGGSMSGFQDVASPTPTQSSSLKVEHKQDSAGMALENRLREAPSPSSVMDTRAIEGNGSSEAVDSAGPRNWDQIKLSGLHTSMSMSDLMNHIGHCISEQMTSGNPPATNGGAEYQDMLEDIAQYLLNDNQSTTASDEKSLMSRVNSLCCLLQKDTAAVPNSQGSGGSCAAGPDGGLQVKNNPEQIHDNKYRADLKVSEQDTRDVSGSKQATGMSRKDSFGDLLLHLPRIASLPKFLFNISEEDSES
uniref:TRF2/HOY1 PH-like domain-containing protein n=1 Tax=Fagus sylvatica TaxID=28930 RepID=A0A2N9HM97_FAGSY